MRAVLPIRFMRGWSAGIILLCFSVPFGAAQSQIGQVMVDSGAIATFYLSVGAGENRPIGGISFPMGTVLKVQISNQINSLVDHEGLVFDGTLVSPLSEGDRVAANAGSRVKGKLILLRNRAHPNGSCYDLLISEISDSGKSFPVVALLHPPSVIGNTLADCPDTITVQVAPAMLNAGDANKEKVKAGSPQETDSGNRAFATGAPGQQPTLQPGPYFALVIGNNNYRYLRRLQTAVNDANSVAELLRERYGFQTRILIDATRQQILDAIVQYRKELPQDSNLLIYYAGHGHHDRDSDESYWLPVDAQADSNANWISADDITRDIRAIASAHVLVISDSCYSGYLAREADAAIDPSERGAYLAKMLKSRSRTLMSSGGDEPVADGGAPGHSIFGATILESLRRIEDNSFTADYLFLKYVQPAVAGRSEQLPQYSVIRNSGHAYGDFIFVRLSNAAKKSTVDELPNPTKPDVSESLKTSGSPLVLLNEQFNGGWILDADVRPAFAASIGARKHSGTPNVASTPNGSEWTYKVDGDELFMTSENGRSYQARLDGTDTPVQGNASGMYVSVKKVATNAIEETYKQGGTVVGVATTTLSHNGKSLSITYTDHVQGRNGQLTARRR